MVTFPLTFDAACVS